MPTSSSLIISDRVNLSQSMRHELDMRSYGCSEFPAHDQYMVRYVSLGLAVLKESSVLPLVKSAFGTERTMVQHMGAWAQFIVDMFNSFDEFAKAPFFEVYTLGDYRKELGNISGRCINLDAKGIQSAGSGSALGTLGPLEMSDDTIIGLQTNANVIRKFAGANYVTEKLTMSNGSNRCRKVQIGHTAYRLMWSQGYLIPIIAMKLKQVSDQEKAGLTHLQCFWLAYKAKYAVSRGGNDYGDIFQYEAGYMSSKVLVKRFMDVKMNEHVIQNFAEEQNPMAKELGLVQSRMTDADVTKRVFNHSSGSLSNAWIIGAISEKSVGNAVALITECEAGLNSSYTQVKFKFSKPLFRSAATGVCYEGILKPNSKLNRILFRDEENCTLSVLSESKFIEVSK